jgi:hypothetical protein
MMLVLLLLLLLLLLLMLVRVSSEECTGVVSRVPRTRCIVLSKPDRLCWNTHTRAAPYKMRVVDTRSAKVARAGVVRLWESRRRRSRMVASTVHLARLRVPAGWEVRSLAGSAGVRRARRVRWRLVREPVCWGVHPAHTIGAR